jgi:hypothetical protein
MGVPIHIRGPEQYGETSAVGNRIVVVINHFFVDIFCLVKLPLETSQLQQI